jgi:hypothetical protein
MNGGPYYRGGSSVKPRPIDIRIVPSTGLLRTDRGISVLDRPDGLARHGGLYRVVSIPPELHMVQVGQNPHHFEIAPVRPMTPGEYDQLTAKIVLVTA